MNDDEDQYLTDHEKKGMNKRKYHDKSLRINQRFQRNTRPKRDFPSSECFNCHKMGHILRNCPFKEEQFKKWNRKFHVHVVKEDESVEENTNEDEDSSEEYVLI